MLEKLFALIIINSLSIWSSCVDAFHIGNFTTTHKYIANDIRSGGYPKFPQSMITHNAYSGNKFYHAYFLQQNNPEKLSSTGCGTRSVHFNPKRNGKIIGGNTAPYGAFPWQVEIQIFNYEKATFEHHCGAAVIGERIVLTAAHCTEVSCSFFFVSILNFKLGFTLMHLSSHRYHSNHIYIW